MSRSPALVSAVATLLLERKTWLLVLRFSLNYWNLIKTNPNPVRGSGDYHELMETLLLLTQHKHVHMSTDGCLVLKQNVASGGDGWAEVTDRYLPCCVVLCCIWVTAARVRWNSCYASPVSEPALLTWTRERRLCVTRPRWSLLLPPHRAALTSSWCFQSYSRKRLTWHISCQGVQTCDLSDMWVSVQPLPNNTALPVRILTSQKWDKLNIKLYGTLKE